MPKGIPVWSIERDDKLRTLHALRREPQAIVDAIGDPRITVNAVIARLGTLGLRSRLVSAPERFWTPEVDTLLRELWAQTEPQLTVMEIVALLPDGATELWVRQRVQDLKLVKREGPKRVRAPSGARAGQVVSEPLRAPPRFTYPKVTGCTFIDPHGDGSRCGKGDTQTCAEHRERMAPIPKGPLGYMQVVYSATGGRIRSARVA